MGEAEKGNQLIRLSDAIKAMKELADAKEMQELGYCYSFLPEVCAELRKLAEGKTMEKHKCVYSQRGDDYLIEAQKVCAEDKPKQPVVCPYCGHKMVHQCVYGDHFFRCPKCRAVAPDKDTEAEAYTAAMQRWQEPNRVLTLSELKEYNGIVWCEYRKAASYNCPGYAENSALRVGEDLLSCCEESQRGYGKYWRCWLRKPTQEEMEVVPWEGD